MAKNKNKESLKDTKQPLEITPEVKEETNEKVVSTDSAPELEINEVDTKKEEFKLTDEMKEDLEEFKKSKPNPHSIERKIAKIKEANQRNYLEEIITLNKDKYGDISIEKVRNALALGFDNPLKVAAEAKCVEDIINKKMEGNKMARFVRVPGVSEEMNILYNKRDWYQVRGYNKKLYEESNGARVVRNFPTDTQLEYLITDQDNINLDLQQVYSLVMNGFMVKNNRTGDVIKPRNVNKYIQLWDKTKSPILVGRDKRG